MDQTGLLNEILKAAETIDQGRKWLDTDGLEREGRINYRKGLARAALAFAEANANVPHDLELLIVAEYTFLNQELHFCASQDTKTIQSLTQALRSFDESLSALRVVESGAAYSAVDQCLPYRKEYRYYGMPKDSFHIACIGHKTRIANILRSPGINLGEKDLLERRYANIITAQAVYVKKQKQALGIE
jgi:hypothetical protein